MQIELPRYIWADTRFKKDAENPLLFYASTKSYDIRTHQVSPLQLDLDFSATGASPRVARSLVALSEIKMLTLPNLLAVQEAGIVEHQGVDPDNKYLTLTGFMMGVAEVGRARFQRAGKIGGPLTAKFMSPFIKYEGLNSVAILDSYCRDTAGKVPGLANNFVVFYRTLLDTVTSRAESLAPLFTADDVKDPLFSERVSESLRKQREGGGPGDKGFERILSKFAEFMRDLSISRPSWIKISNSEIDPRLTEELWNAYCSEIESGISFLSVGTEKTGHKKILTHKHRLDLSDTREICNLHTGTQSVPQYFLATAIASIEPLSRCPFFTGRGWLDTHIERPSDDAS